MAGFSDREKGPPEDAAKWDFITLSDFRCTSAWTIFWYIWLWFLALVGIAVYVVDTYTAVNLLAFDNWSSAVQPALALKYSKWIFAICILLSWALFFYEFIRAIRVIRRGGVAESFLDPLAVNIQSMRRQGFKRFLVFTELTKSKKGADYVALFVYFSFQSAIRIIVAEGPRQAVNAMTLYALLTADLIPDESTERSKFDQFWYNVQQIANHDQRQAIIYFTMLFTLVIWVFSAICLILSGILYITFLWHYIPQRDGRLSVYCKRKVDRRLAKIVEHKVKAAIEEEERKKEKADRKAELKRQKTGEPPPPNAPYLKKQPTLPILGETPELGKVDKSPEFPLVRRDTAQTIATLPPYTSRPPTGNESSGMSGQPTLPRIDTGARPGMPMRNVTSSSQWSEAPSYRSQAPLLANAGFAGGAEDVPLPPSAISRQDSYASFESPFHRPNNSQGSINSVRSAQMRAFTSGPSQSRAQTPMSVRSNMPGPYNGPDYTRHPAQPRIPLPVRSNTAFGYDQDPLSASSFATSQDSYDRSFVTPSRSNTAEGIRPVQHTDFSALHSQNSFSRPVPRKPLAGSFGRACAPATVPEDYSAAPDSYEMRSAPAHAQPPPPPKDNRYLAFNPSIRSATPATQEASRRNITLPHGAPANGSDDYFNQVYSGVPQRSATAPITPMEPAQARPGYIVDDYDGSGLYRPQPPLGPARSNTAGPGKHGQW